VTTILGLSGSLRAASLNSMLLRACARLAPPGVVLELDVDMGGLPLFNADLEPRDPAPVAALRARIVAADAVLIASPEYAHGVSGVMKNALDWMVGNESFVAKPVALLNASPRASLAQAALRETLSTMSAHIVEAACVAVLLLGSGLSEDALVADPVLATVLRGSLAELRRAAAAQRAH
jgi:chromate reductase